MKSIQIYLGCEFSEYPERVCKRIKNKMRDLVRALRNDGHSVFFSQGTSKGRYPAEKEQIERSDLCVFFTELPSTGHGVKMMLAVGAGVPVLLLSRATMTGTLVEVASDEPFVTLKRYPDWRVIPSYIKKELSVRGIAVVA